jgi:hypothetical protein
MEASIVISGIIGAAMNSIPKGIMRLVSGEPMDDMFWFTFASDFIVGFECGMAFAAIGFLATQFLLLSCLVKSILFTMGLKFSFDCIGDLWNGNYGSAILNAIGAAFCFFGASGFNYKGSGLGLGGFADDAANLADETSSAIDDLVNVLDDLPSGWTKTSNNGFIHIRDEYGVIRIRIDPPTAQTPFDHIHFYDELRNPLDINGNIVPKNSPSAHIPINPEGI